MYTCCVYIYTHLHTQVSLFPHSKAAVTISARMNARFSLSFTYPPFHAHVCAPHLLESTRCVHLLCHMQNNANDNVLVRIHTQTFYARKTFGVVFSTPSFDLATLRLHILFKRFYDTHTRTPLLSFTSLPFKRLSAGLRRLSLRPAPRLNGKTHLIVVWCLMRQERGFRTGKGE